MTVTPSIPDVEESTGLVVRPSPAPYPFGPASVAAVLDEAKTIHPNRVALVDGLRRWTYAELDAAVDLTARQLASAGITPGRRVVWSLTNCAELVIGFLATARCGAVWVGLHARLPHRGKDELLSRINPTLVIDSPSVLDGRDPNADSPRAPVDPFAPAAIAFTSGTTGTPKGVVHSQHNLLWPGLASCETEPPGDIDITGTPLPLSSLNMMVLGPLTAFLRGGTAVVLDRALGDELAADIAAAGLTRALVVPTILHDLTLGEVEASQLASLRTVLVGGAGTPQSLVQSFGERFGLSPTLSYGLTEAPTGVARTGAQPDRGATPLPPVAISIRDDDGQQLPSGQEGEVCLSPAPTGPWAGTWTGTLGYWLDPKATRSLYRGGVLHTADVGVIDEHGCLRVRGRVGDVIVRGGANIHPVEVERVLLSHPDIETAAVVGVPDERLGERVGAAVTGRGIDLEGVEAHCRERLAPYKVPDVLVVIDEIPTNTGGKIIRAEVQSLLTDA